MIHHSESEYLLALQLTNTSGACEEGNCEEAVDGPAAIADDPDDADDADDDPDDADNASSVTPGEYQCYICRLG